MLSSTKNYQAFITWGSGIDSSIVHVLRSLNLSEISLKIRNQKLSISTFENKNL